MLPVLVTRPMLFRDTDAVLTSLPRRPRCTGSGRVPRESLDAPDDLPKEALRQVALGQLELLPGRSSGNAWEIGRRP